MKSRATELPARVANFIEPMECLAVSKIPEGSQWTYEIKLDGYRAVAVKSGTNLSLRSRRNKSFNAQYPYLLDPLKDLPDESVVDGEVVALVDAGTPNFHLLQEFRKQASRIHYFIFDLLVCEGRDLTKLPLSERRRLLQTFVKPASSRIRLSDQFDVTADQMLAAVRGHKLEGVVAKRKDSLYEPGERSGSWSKFRLNRGQELVIGGFIPGSHGIESLIVGYYRGNDLVYVARVRAGFVPASRRSVYHRLRGLVSSEMPFVNLPEKSPSRWGDALTADKMNKCVWVRPEAVAQIEFLDWTDADRLRHSKFIALRDDKDAHSVVKEQGRE